MFTAPAAERSASARGRYSSRAARLAHCRSRAPGYVYDGEGRRVKKTLGEATRFVYGVGGQLLAEYDAATGALERENVYGADGLLASVVPSAQAGAGAQYATADRLASPRVVTGAGGAVVSRRDYKPFGEEIAAGVGGRTTAQGYAGADNIRQKFTGKERDSETGLDYFLARYHASAQGRFTSPDPLLSSGSAYDPQTWNRYSYTINNPLKYTDPFGMYICQGDKGQCKEVEKGLKDLTKSRDTFKKGSEEYNKIDRSLKAYGAAGVDNGVTIKFGATKNGGPAEASIGIRDKDRNGVKDVTADNPTGQDTIVTIDPAQNKNTGDYAMSLGHEGSHVADGSELVGALPTNLSDPSLATVLGGPLNLTKYATEKRAFQIDSLIAQARGADWLRVGAARIEIWNSGWSQADRATKRTAGIDQVLAVPKSAGGLYGVTSAEDEQGVRLIPFP